MFACSSCQFFRLSLLMPNIMPLLACLGIAAIFLLLTYDKEGASAKDKGCATIFLAAAFFAGLFVMPLLVFPLLLLVIPLCLVTKLFSKSKQARVMALMGLLPMILLALKGKYEKSQAGPYYRLDRLTLSEHFTSQMGANPLPELSDEQLISTLSQETGKRKENAVQILKQKARHTTDVKRLQSNLNEVSALATGKDETVTDLVELYQSAIQKSLAPSKK